MTLPSAVEVHAIDSALGSLTPKQRAFVWNYVCGDTDIRGVASRAYIAAGYTASTLGSAYAASSVLLRHPNVRAAMEEVRGIVEEQAKAQMQPWLVLAVEAQQILAAHLRSETILTETRQKTLFHILDRALGRPAQPVEQEIGERFDALIRELTQEEPDQAEPQRLEAHGTEVDALIEEIGQQETEELGPPVGPQVPEREPVGVGAPRKSNDQGSTPNSSDGEPLSPKLVP